MLYSIKNLDMNLLEDAFALLRMPELNSAGVAFLASFMLSIAVVLTKCWHGGVFKGHHRWHSKVSICPYATHRRHSNSIGFGDGFGNCEGHIAAGLNTVNEGIAEHVGLDVQVSHVLVQSGGARGVANL